LHFGSLLTALASYLDCRRRGGVWLLRIDDNDQPRSVATAESDICQALELHGLEWDGAIVRSSDNQQAYRQVITTLGAADKLFYCNCTRASLRATPIYPGTCRHVRHAPDYPTAIRVQLPAVDLEFHDELQGQQKFHLPTDAGDFILRRRDGLFSYQLTVVVDDALSGITRVVRGADLLANTPRQLALTKMLGYSIPAYLHLPTLMDRRNTKLSKQTHARDLSKGHETSNVHTALQLLGQQPPAEGLRWDVRELLQWASLHWQAAQLPRALTWTDFVAH
jgi:glutamyl-Q tRNA(Asp) synthetase